jgi:hypothetical protein
MKSEIPNGCVQVQRRGSIVASTPVVHVKPVSDTYKGWFYALWCRGAILAIRLRSVAIPISQHVGVSPPKQHTLVEDISAEVAQW